MRRICAWCKKEINPPENELDMRVSHGICVECENNLDFQMGVPLKVYLNAIKLPVMVVTKDVRTIFANEAALEIIGKDMEEIYGELGGDVFECEFARQPGGCGRTVHCSGCAIRNTVNETVRTNKPQVNVPASLHCTKKDKPQEIELFISTEMTGNIVLLWIDKIDVTGS
jgi:hypothetical protein